VTYVHHIGRTGLSKMLEQASRMSSSQQNTEENLYKRISGNEWFLSSVERSHPTINTVMYNTLLNN
jgi:hypothetical protein